MSAYILRRNLGNLCPQVRHSLHPQQLRQSRHFWEATSAVPAIPAGNFLIFFQSEHAITHSWPAISEIPAISPTVSAISIILEMSAFWALPSISAVSAMAAGNLRRNLNNLGQDFRNLGLKIRHPQQPCQSRQYGTAISAMTALSATPAVSAILGGNLCSPSNSGRQYCQFCQSRHAISHSRPAMSVTAAISVDTLGDLGTFAKVGDLGTLGNLCWHFPSQSRQPLSLKSAN